MATHWTYLEALPKDHLSQGDILLRSAELLKILDKVHPWFSDEKYSGFLVTTQSCDLVIRHGTCKAQHVNLVPIQPLSRLLPKLAKSTCEGFRGCLEEESKDRLRQLLDRVINQNEQAMGLFYLHSDNDVGISEPSVAQLRVGISLKIEHYPILQSARCGKLTEVFSAKMGWLAGNLYSRVATPDWTESPETSATAKTLVEGLLADCGPWAPRACLKAASKDPAAFEGLDTAGVVSKLREYAPIPAKEKGLTAARDTVNKLLSDAKIRIQKQVRVELFKEEYRKRVEAAIARALELNSSNDVGAEFAGEVFQGLMDGISEGIAGVVNSELDHASAKVDPRLRNDPILKSCFRTP